MRDMKKVLKFFKSQAISSFLAQQIKTFSLSSNKKLSEFLISKKKKFCVVDEWGEKQKFFLFSGFVHEKH